MTEQPTIPFCKDCVHFEHRDSVSLPMGGVYIPPAALCRRMLMPVFGNPMDADLVRSDRMLCGWDGVWFEQKAPEADRQPVGFWLRLARALT